MKIPPIKRKFLGMAAALILAGAGLGLVPAGDAHAGTIKIFKFGDSGVVWICHYSDSGALQYCDITSVKK